MQDCLWEGGGSDHEVILKQVTRRAETVHTWLTRITNLKLICPVMHCPVQRVSVCSFDLVPNVGFWVFSGEKVKCKHSLHQMFPQQEISGW